MQDNDQEQGTATLDQSAPEEPAHIAFLRSAGASEDVIKEAENGYLRQSDYTRKTQETASFRDQVAQQQAALAQQMAYLQGQAAAGGNGGPKTKLQTFLANLEQDESGKAVAPLFREFADSLQGDIVPQFDAKLQQQVAPIQQATFYDRIDKTLEQILQQELIPMYGKDVVKYWPQIKQGTLNLISQGNVHATPQQVFQTYFADDAMTLRAAKRAAAQQRQQQQSMTGFDTTRRKNPLPQGDNQVRNKRPDIGELTEQWLANRDRKLKKG